MRIHLAALAAASLFVLAGPRLQSSQAHQQGIPLGDLVRARPVAVTQLTPNLGGTSSTGSSTSSTGSTGGSQSTLGTPSSTVGTIGGAGTNLTTPGLPSPTPSTSTVGGVPTTGMPATSGAPATGGTNPTPGNP